MRFLIACPLVSAYATAAASLLHPQRHDQRLSSPWRRRGRRLADPSDGIINQDESTPSSSSSEPLKIQTYALWEAEAVSATLLEWAQHYPHFVRVTTAQEAYGLPRAGTAADCPFDAGGDGCLNYILTIQDFQKHPEDSDSSRRLPEVFWSGEVHGNERVGPTAVLEAAQLLLDAATCESLPRFSIKSEIADWEAELEAARNCRADWSARGYAEADRRWLARLVGTRRIVVVPTANALGYFRNVREEGTVDPNRDFPYDLQDPTQCMQTVAGRTINEVFREHMFQLSLTFHGGMEVIGVEWGAPSWTKPSISPDDTAQMAIAAAYSQYGGGFAQSKPYAYGNMNDLVYPVRGGMEDFAFAGSWDTKRVIQCEPTTFGGYPKEKTIYGPSTLRMFNMLVESSNQKIPAPSTLGTSENLLRHSASDGTKGNGYVSRNIRLSLLAAELVEPYVSFMKVNELELTNDIVPLVRDEGRSCKDTMTVQVPYSSRKTIVQWRVGGSLTINDTRLFYARWDDVPEALLDCLAQPSFDDIQQHFKEAKLLTDARGTTSFSKDGGAGQPFAGSLDISDGLKPNDKLVVLAVTRVDQEWGSLIEQANPHIDPQSHIVNARTNTSWYHESAGKIIEGRLYWFSYPLTIVLGDYEDINKDQTVDTIELSNRFGKSGTPATPEPTSSSTTSPIWIATVVLCLGALCFGLRTLRLRVRQARRERLRELIGQAAPATSTEQSKSTYYDAVGDVRDDGGELELGEYT